MRLGNFSISLAVRDLAASKAFYEKFGFVTFVSDANVGDVLLIEADESTKGPGIFVAVDRDGNPILVDQHV